MVHGEVRDKTRHAYRPGVEAMEVLRLLSGVLGSAAVPLPQGAADFALDSPIATPTPTSTPTATHADLAGGLNLGDTNAFDTDRTGAALAALQTGGDLNWLEDYLDATAILSDVGGDPGAGANAGFDAALAASPVNSALAALGNADWANWSPTLTDLSLTPGGRAGKTDATPQEGLDQLSRYMTRAWFRAGIAPQKHEDCSQAVFLTLLEHLGRERFDHLLNDVSQQGIRDVFHKDVTEGLDFFRAIDMVKKRAQRERTWQSLDDGFDFPSTSGTANGLAGSVRDPIAVWRDALDELLTTALSPREAELIQATIEGETPAEIAARWGVASKTVSNEKSRVLQKLRSLIDE